MHNELMVDPQDQLKDFVTIYIWDRNIFKKIVGHVAMRTYRGGVDNKGYYISCTPNTSIDTPTKSLVSQTFDMKKMPTLETDFDAEYSHFPSYVIHLRTLKIDKINAAYEKILANPIMVYNFFQGNGILKSENKNNCVGLVLSLLNEGGLDNIIDCKKLFEVAEGKESQWKKASKVFCLIVLATIILISILFTLYFIVKCTFGDACKKTKEYHGAIADSVQNMLNSEIPTIDDPLSNLLNNFIFQPCDVKKLVLEAYKKELVNLRINRSNYLIVQKCYFDQAIKLAQSGQADYGELVRSIRSIHEVNDENVKPFTVMEWVSRELVHHLPDVSTLYESTFKPLFFNRSKPALLLATKCDINMPEIDKPASTVSQNFKR